MRALIMVSALTLLGCGNAPSVGDVTPDAGTTPEPVDGAVVLFDAAPAPVDAPPMLALDAGGEEPPPSLGLRPIADPSFRVEALPPEVREAHQALLASIADDRRRFTDPSVPGGYDVPDAWHCPSETNGPSYNGARTMGEAACRGDEYTLARQLSEHIYALVYLLRVSHDGAILDELDRLMQLARSTLVDRCVPRYPADAPDAYCDSGEDASGRDGHPNWRYLRDVRPLGTDEGSWGHVGTDYHRMEEMLIHGWVAMVAWIYQQNVDHPEHGARFVERADFWRTYLFDHFEVKWEERERARPGLARSPSDLPFSNLQHPTTRLTAYYWYASRLLAESDPERAAEYAALSTRRLERLFASDLRAEASPSGERWIWAHQQDLPTLQMSVYASYTTITLAELALEAHPALEGRGTLAALGATLREDLFDPSRDDASTPFRVAVGQSRPPGAWRECPGSGAVACVTVDGRVFRRYDNEAKSRPRISSFLTVLTPFGLEDDDTLGTLDLWRRVETAAAPSSAFAARASVAFARHWQSLEARPE